MTREEAVNWLINIMSDIGKSQHRDLWHYEQALAEIKKMLEEEPQWISCSEKLPEPNEVVLISVNGTVDADWIAVDNTGYGCWYRCMKDVMSVDAWMPLPEPYKGGALPEPYKGGDTE